MFLGVDVGTGGTRAVVVDRTGGVVASAGPRARTHLQPAGRLGRAGPRRLVARGPGSPSPLSSRRPAPWKLSASPARCTAASCSTPKATFSGPLSSGATSAPSPSATGLKPLIGRRAPHRACVQSPRSPTSPSPSSSGSVTTSRRSSPAFATSSAPRTFVRLRLTGEYAMDVQEASGTLLLDVVHRRWSEEIAEAAGIPVSWLPTGSSRAPRSALASRMPAPPPLASSKAHPSSPGQATRVPEPSAWASWPPAWSPPPSAPAASSSPPPTSPPPDPIGRLHTFCHAAPGLWHVMGVTNGAGLSLRWLRDTFFPAFSYDQLTLEAAAISPGSDGLLWTPYLFGERTPHLDPLARAAFTGISASTTRGHFVRAVMEGVAFSLRDTLSLFQSSRCPCRSPSASEAAEHALLSGVRSRPTCSACP